MSDLLRFIFTTQEPFQHPARLASLYSDFAIQEHNNPDGYRANLDAWRNALSAAAKAGLIPASGGGGITVKGRRNNSSGAGAVDVQRDRLVLCTGEELARALETRDWGQPIGLGRVIEDAARKREFIPLDEFLQAKTSIYSKTWIPSLRDVVSWGWKQFGFGGIAGQAVPTGKWVVLENLEAASRELLGHISNLPPSPTSAIHTLATLNASLPQQLSAEDMSVLLSYLSRDKPHLAFKKLGPSPNETIIKISHSTMQSAQTITITETDINIAQLKTLLHSLESQMPPLETAVADLTAKARAAVSASQTSTARAALRRKKLVQDTLDQRRTGALQLSEILARIEQAQDQAATLRAMEQGAAVLKSLNRESGGVEAAERASEALAQQVQTVDEVAGVLNEVGASSTAAAVDEDELDDELEAMANEEKAKAEKKQLQKLQQQQDAEAEKTRQRFEELKELERKRDAATVGKTYSSPQDAEQAHVEAEIDDTTEDISRLSVEDHKEGRGQGQPIAEQ